MQNYQKPTFPPLHPTQAFSSYNPSNMAEEESHLLPEPAELNIIFFKVPKIQMYYQDINTILDTPPCPKIKPREQLPDFLDLQFQLEPSQTFEQEGPDFLKLDEEPSTQPESTQMVDEADEGIFTGKRTYREYLGLNQGRPTISHILSTPLACYKGAQFKPRKIRHL